MLKTKLLALLLAVAMVASMIVVPVAYAESGTPAPDEETDVSTPIEALPVTCEKCGTADWTEVKEGDWTGGQLPGDHYQLTSDQTLTAALTVAAGTEVCIDLNGYTIAADTADGPHRNIESAGNLVIMDSSENESGTIEGGKTLDKGTTDAIGEDEGDVGGNIYVSGGTFELYSGTITGGVAKRGGNVHVASSIFNMYGGTVTGGNANRGGNVYVTYVSNTQARGVANIYGGTICDGRDNDFGANLCVITGSKVTPHNILNIYGGTISGGTSKLQSISNSCSDMNIYGGKISSTVGSYAGGSSSNVAKTTIYGGTFTGDMALNTTNAEINIYNGEFITDVSEYKATCACVDGNKVWHYKEDCGCAYETALTADAADDKYTIVPQTGSHTPAPDVNSTTGYSCSFCATPDLLKPADKEGLCADTACTVIHTWQPWTGVETNGYYYVSGSFTLPAQVTVADGKTLCLDLNGMTVTSANKTRMFLVDAGGTLNLMDLTGNNGGTLQGTTYTSGNGAVVVCKGTFNLYSGTIQGGTVNRTTTAHGFGGNIDINAGTFYMYGGIVKDGTVKAKSGQYAYGGNICVREGGSATIHGGVIENGNSGHRGGNIGLYNSGAVTIKTGVIVRGGAAATVRTEDGNGANIFVPNGTTLTIESGVTIGVAGENNIALHNIGMGEKATLTFYDDPAAIQGNWDAYNTTKDEAEVTCYVPYTDLATALTAADVGDTVNLATDITGADEITLNGETLNLNGHILTADVDATIGNVVDSTDGTGKVVGDVTTDDNEKLHVVIPNENGNENYFEDVTLGNSPDHETPFVVGNKVAKYTVYVNKDKDLTMIDEALNAGTVQLSIKVSYKVGDVDQEPKVFVLDNPELIAMYVDPENFNSKMLRVTISNIPENVTELSCEFKIEKSPAQETVE